MARYKGPKSKIARKFREPIFGPDKALEKKNYPPGVHGPNKRRMKRSEYAIQLAEKQKAKYTYGILERQFSNMFKKASSTFNVTVVDDPDVVKFVPPAIVKLAAPDETFKAPPESAVNDTAVISPDPPPPPPPLFATQLNTPLPFVERT